MIIIREIVVLFNISKGCPEVIAQERRCPEYRLERDYFPKQEDKKISFCNYFSSRFIPAENEERSDKQGVVSSLEEVAAFYGITTRQINRELWYAYNFAQRRCAFLKKEGRAY